MRKLREILRLKMGLGLSARQVAKSCNISRTTVAEYERRLLEAGLGWPLPDDIDDVKLEGIVRARPESFSKSRPMPETDYLIKEMRKKHVTLSLLWLEYRERFPEGYGYTQFCHYYSQAKDKLDVVTGRGRSFSPTTPATHSG